MLSINGSSFELKGAEPSQSLASFLRHQAGDTSVHVGCASGGCGACTVAVIPPSGQGMRTINSCLAPVGALSGCSIITAAGMGSSSAGFHPVQERMAAFHASQCGFCTPGFVAALGAALHKAQAEGREVDGAELACQLDGNLCRCTGYRPIHDVCSSFVSGCDIEDLGLHTPVNNVAANNDCLLLQATPTATCPAAHNGTQPLVADGRTWVAPSNLQELLDACAAAGDPGSPPLVPRFVGGNTGAGLFKELWPADDKLVVTVGHVEDMRKTSLNEGHLVLGAAVTIAEAVATLSSHAAKLEHGKPFGAMAAMLARVAGAHVRQAGTVGGNLVLAKQKGLESDLATALMGWGASVLMLDVGAALKHAAGKSSSGGSPRSVVNGNPGSHQLLEVPVEEFLSKKHQMGAGQLLVALQLPLPQPGDYFWCHKLTLAYSGVHSTLNAAVKINAGSSGPRVVFGYYNSPTGWVAHRSSATEAALAGTELTASTMAAALAAVPADMSPARPQSASMAQGQLLQALAPAVRQHCEAKGGVPPHLECLLQVPVTNEPPPAMHGSQTFDPPQPELAPLGAPLEKDRVRLQASGEAQYVGDVPAPAGTLYAAFVTSTQARAPISSIEASAALELPDVVGFIAASDLPSERNVISCGVPMPPEPIFAADRVEYHSQPVGVVVARTQAAAHRGAQAVSVSYGPAEPPVTTIEEARKHSSFYELPMLAKTCEQGAGDAAAAIQAAPLRIMAGSLEVPATYHFYMEPQNALAVPDEGGSIKVFSSAQDVDTVQKVVAHTLGLRRHEVEAVCRRAGGGFGAKFSRNLPVALAAAVAATKTKRPVRFVLDRVTDMRLNGGRCAALAEFDVGCNEDGVIQGLSLHVFLMMGAFPDVPVDAMVLPELVGMGYCFPNFSVSVKMCRGNLPPATAMRAPGGAQGAIIIEHIMDQVAALCGLDAATVRERNFARLPPPLPPTQLTAAGQGIQCVQEPEPEASAPKVRLALGKEVPADEYSLPRLWHHLKTSCSYDERLAEVERFNSSSTWLKRGLGMTHSRFDCFTSSKAAYVSIYPDGSVICFAGGSEIGQGLTTKVKQVALMELSKLLPEASRPLPPELVRMGDQSTYTLPAVGFTGGSTTSESACAAVRQACGQLVERLRPFAEELREGGTWADLMAAVAKANPMMDPCKIPLTAYGHTAGGLAYCVWGAACTEVELNVLTGERTILRSDICVDVGRSMNPAIDIGQVEGAFAMGLGHCLSEARHYDAGTGRLLSDSLWEFHPPIAAALPQQLNVTFLPGSQLKRSVLSSKAVGEPPLMLAPSALSALQAAATAATEQLAALGAIKDSGSAPHIKLPASPENLMAALGGADRNLAAAFVN